MTILLDENFPLQLYHRLRKMEVPVEHIIVLGQRGLQDFLERHPPEQLFDLLENGQIIPWKVL